jgi:hypothetical protein
MSRLNLFCLTVLGALLLASTTQAAVIVSDNFDGYATQAAFEAVWTPSGSGTAPANTGLVSTAQSYSAPQSINYGTAAGLRNSRAITGALATNLVEDLEWSFRFYDPTGTANSPRQYSELVQGVGTGSGQLIAMGVTNTVVGNKYYGRVVGIDPDGAGPLALGAFFQFDAASPNRSVGWHEFKALVHNNGANASVDFYVDGVLSKTLSGFSNRSYDTLRMGSNVSSAGGQAWFDNQSLQTVAVPEPAALGLLGVAAFGFLRRRRA